MSEQEKNNAIPVEGEVKEQEPETKKEGWFKRMVHNPKVRKVARWIGRALEIGAGLGIGFALGKASGGGSSSAEDQVALEEAESPSEEDPIEEPSANE